MEVANALRSLQFDQTALDFDMLAFTRVCVHFSMGQFAVTRQVDSLGPPTFGSVFRGWLPNPAPKSKKGRLLLSHQDSIWKEPGSQERQAWDDNAQPTIFSRKLGWRYAAQCSPKSRFRLDLWILPAFQRHPTQIYLPPKAKELPANKS